MIYRFISTALCGFALLAAAPLLPADAMTAENDYPVRPVEFNAVELTDNFWRPRLETQRKVLVPHAFEQTKPGLAHLQAAADFLAGKGAGEHRPHRYIDSDLYKVMEGASYLLQLEPDPQLEQKMDEIIAVITAAQQADGYLYPSHITGVGTFDHMTGSRPYQYVVHSHELYNMGHLYEAAVAYWRATGKDTLLQVAEKNARHVNKVFFEGDPNYNDGKPVNQASGHQEIELALVKLGRATGNDLYLQMADRFLQIRGRTYRPDGRGVMSPTYAQQHAPVEEQAEAVGHAVRAAYQYAAMADVAAITGNEGYKNALDAIWHNIVDTRMHLTGGMGAVHGIEGFGPPYELPNADAYNETCAAVGNVMVNYRMFLMHEDARYLDVAEVALYNNVLAGVNLEGNKFFYVNPLEADGQRPFNHGAAGRVGWFGTACCPTNLARLIPQIGGMAYAARDDALIVAFYVGSKTTVPLAGGDVKVEQETNYPNDGTVRLTLDPGDARDFDLKLRIPTWAGDGFVPGDLYTYLDDSQQPWTLTVNGEPLEAVVDNGFATVRRTWAPGDVVELHLPMPVRFNTSDERVEANQDRVALTRGPLVLAAEEADNGLVQRLALEEIPTSDAITVDTVDIIENHPAIRVSLPAKAVEAEGPADATLTLIPYYAWNNRGQGSMIVWLPRKTDRVRYVAGDRIVGGDFKKITASHTNPSDTTAALVDGKRPRSSRDRSIPRWTSWPETAQPQWVELELREPKQIRSVGVYWYDDKGGVQVPFRWRLEVRSDGQWKPFELYVTDSYQTRPDQYNIVHPAAAITADAIRLHLEATPDAAIGILDVDVAFEE